MINKIKVDFDVPAPTNRRERVTVQVTDKNNDFFVELWNKISHKVKYEVRFSENRLIDDVVNGKNPLSEIQFKQMTATQLRARINMNANKVDGEVTGQRTQHLSWADLPIINVPKQLADRTGLTRQAIIKMIQGSQERDHNFIDNIKMNPTLFVQRALRNIRAHERNLLSNSLVYILSGETWDQNLLRSYDAQMDSLWTVPERGTTKTLFNKIATQSGEEDEFAKQLILEDKIKYFLKLPNWFKIPTPFGNYVPDWAILAETDGMQRLYFVVDTKSEMDLSDLREDEQARILAGRQSYKVFKDINFQAPVKVIGDLKI